MAANTKSWLVLSLFILSATCMQQYCVHGEPQIPCFYVFGDSLSDNGNNNNLPTSAKSNYRPYGIDFPTGPTGRFTNGRTAVDFLSELFEYPEPIPPYANTSGSDILKGVNYASGSAGIRFESGKRLGDNIHLGEQIRNHKVIYSRIVSQLGGIRRAREYLNKCLYYVNIGSNDYINNYFLPQFYPSSRVFNLDQYTDILIKQYLDDIEELHEVAARKYVIVGMGLIGCTPHAISTRGTNGSLCVDELNNAAFLFNNKLQTKVEQLSNKYAADSKFVFIDSTAGTLDESLGFTNVNGSCCPTRSDGQCVENGRPCENRDTFIFYDGFHPTSAANQFIALSSYAQILPLIHPS